LRRDTSCRRSERAGGELASCCSVTGHLRTWSGSRVYRPRRGRNCWCGLLLVSRQSATGAAWPMKIGTIASSNAMMPHPAESGQRCNPESMQDRRAQEAYNAASQAVLGPHGLNLLVGCEFAAAGGGLGAGNRLALFGRKDNRRGKVGARKLHDGARDVILIV
jgi:hypothetical protein